MKALTYDTRAADALTSFLDSAEACGWKSGEHIPVVGGQHGYSMVIGV